MTDTVKSDDLIGREVIVVADCAFTGEEGVITEIRPGLLPIGVQLKDKDETLLWCNLKELSE